MTWTVADVMTRDVVTIGPEDSLKTCADLMRVHQVSALPVVGAGNRIVGIVSEADLMQVAAAPELRAGTGDARDLRPPTAAEMMTRDLVLIRLDATIASAARLMCDRHVKRLPVVDAAGHLRGIVSRADVVRVFLRSDESIRKEVVHGLLDELPLLGRGRVKVEVRDGVVHLFGRVESSDLTGLLIRLVVAVPGVAGVEDHLERAESPAQAASTGRATGGGPGA